MYATIARRQAPQRKFFRPSGAVSGAGFVKNFYNFGRRGCIIPKRRADGPSGRHFRPLFVGKTQAAGVQHIAPAAAAKVGRRKRTEGLFRRKKVPKKGRKNAASREKSRALVQTSAVLVRTNGEKVGPDCGKSVANAPLRPQKSPSGAQNARRVCQKNLQFSRSAPPPYAVPRPRRPGRRKGFRKRAAHGGDGQICRRGGRM